ncbi:Methyltransferase [Carpediemonas membranifera]|uniref:Methyltransferase n=1 Tax=Carpediemonas membranifera TaxID=201153 RepID=A0A8J6E370_9EUKA|nr:Methyltransferase [Carpediemonas membranifera]|eukprot:KAG9395231.1 Methyltransferase [Carpediemonas membranifera]
MPAVRKLLELSSAVRHQHRLTRSRPISKPIIQATMPVDYSTASYWDMRYLNDQADKQEWLITPEALDEHLVPLLSQESEILVIGCGNSELSAYLYNQGYMNITNVDFSAVVIAEMRERYVNLPSMAHHVMNIARLDFSDEEFDVVIDKGTTDSIFCGGDSFIRANAVFQEVHRVLKPDGLYYMVSHAGPDRRREHLGRGIPWKSRLHRVIEHRSQAVHLYASRKGLPLTERQPRVEDADVFSDSVARGHRRVPP